MLSYPYLALFIPKMQTQSKWTKAKIQSKRIFNPLPTKGLAHIDAGQAHRVIRISQSLFEVSRCLLML